MADLVILVVGGILVVAGVFGSILPFLPGPPLSYLGLLLLQVSSRQPLSLALLITYGCITILVAAIDYIIPAYTTKKYQGSKYGVRGSAAGLIAGLLFFPPFGVIIGPPTGAFLGELLSGKRLHRALKSATGSLVGLFAGTTIKLIITLLMAYHFFANLF